MSTDVLERPATAEADRVVGSLVLRKPKGEPGVRGEFRIFNLKPIMITGLIWPEHMELNGNQTRGEIRRDKAHRLVGELCHMGYPYKLAGEWDDEDSGWVLRCKVMK